MELRVLNYFLMVAREENITKAANLLHVTQPTLSRQLMQLEDELGCKLFERTSHSILLTEDGQLLRRRAQEIVSLVDKTQNEFLQETELSGEIAIGSGEMKSFHILAEIMAEFKRDNPNVHFDVYSGNADDIKDRIESGLIDVGLLTEPVDVGKYDFVRLPQKERWGVVVRTDSPLATKEYITPDDILDLPLIVAKRSMVQKELSSWFGNSENERNIVSSYNLIYNAVMQVKSGVGNLLCLDLEAKYEGVKFIPLNPALEVGTVFVWKKNNATSLATEKFIQWTGEYLKNNK